MFGLDGQHENKTAREMSVARTKKVLSIELLFFTDSFPGYESRVFDDYSMAMQTNHYLVLPPLQQRNGPTPLS